MTEPRKRPRQSSPLGDRADAAPRQLNTGPQNPHYPPDLSARTMDDIVFNSSPALQAEHGGLDLNDGQELPDQASVPRFSYAKGVAAPPPVSEDAGEAKPKSLQELASLLRSTLEQDAAIDPTPAPPVKKPASTRLTVNMVKVDVLDDPTAAKRGNGGPGQGWTRTAANNYLLPEEDRAKVYRGLVDDNLRTEGQKQPALTLAEKDLIGKMIKPMIDLWPIAAVDEVKLYNRRYTLYNGYTLFHQYLGEALSSRASQAIKEHKDRNGGADPKKKPVAHELYEKLNEHDPEHSLKRAVWQSVVNRLNDQYDGVHPNDGQARIKGKTAQEPFDGILYAIEHARRLREAVDAVRKIGMKARRVAAWVRVVACPESEVEALKGKGVAETKVIYELGLKTGAFEAGEVLTVDETWNRIERPDENDRQLRAVFIYEAVDENDYEPSTEKIVGGCIYNAHILADLTTEFHMHHDEDVHASAIDALLTQTPIKRGILDNNGTVKLREGMHEMNGQLQTSAFASSVPKSKNILDQASFRRQYKDRRDISQLWSFEMMATFMPHFAASQLRACRDSGLVNMFGTPAYACFGSWGYFSAAHFDQDDGATHADVTERGVSVHPDSSNFFYGKYKLILELAHKARWFWDAYKSLHGTTLTYPSVAYPGKWKLFVRHGHLRQTGQITSAFVTTKDQHSAAKRQLSPA